MLTLYHAPHSRSSRIVQLLDDLGALDRVEVRITDIARHDGTGARDPANPHPDGKVPCLVHDGTVTSESAAVLLYLTDLFPEAGLAPVAGDPQRGAYLTWLAWYGNVVEPLVEFHILGIDHPGLAGTFRTLDEVGARLDAALADRPFLMGETFGAADLLVSSVFGWMPATTPDRPAVRDWVARCAAHPSATRQAARDVEVRAA